jgi:hypothetical protein
MFYAHPGNILHKKTALRITPSSSITGIVDRRNINLTGRNAVLKASLTNMNGRSDIPV